MKADLATVKADLAPASEELPSDHPKKLSTPPDQAIPLSAVLQLLSAGAQGTATTAQPRLPSTDASPANPSLLQMPPFRSQHERGVESNQQLGDVSASSAPKPASSNAISIFTRPEPTTPLSALQTEVRRWVRQKAQLSGETATELLEELSERERFPPKAIEAIYKTMLDLNLLQGKYKMEDAPKKIALAIIGTLPALSRFSNCRLLPVVIEFTKLMLLAISKVMKPLLTNDRREWKNKIMPVAKIGMFFMMLLVMFSDDSPFKSIRSFYTLTGAQLENLGNSEVIYALLSTQSEKFYIGRTDNFQRRARDHYYASVKGDPQKVYTHIRMNGISNYFLVPLHVIDPNVGDATATETGFIRRLRPHLNTQHAKKRKRTRSRAPIKLRKKKKLGK